MEQNEIVSQLDSLSESNVRGIVEADASDVASRELCSNDTDHGPGVVCGPQDFGYELCVSCAATAVEQWLADPHHGPREILSLDVLA